MKKLLFLLLPLVTLFTGCNLGCDVEGIISSNLAGALSSPAILNCNATGQAAMQADIAKILNLTKVCEVAKLGNDKLAGVSGAAKQGVVAGLVCPIVVSTGIAFLGNQIPATWQCAPTIASATLSTALLAACNTLPF